MANRGDTYQYSFKLYKLNTTPKEYIDGSQYSEVECQFNNQAFINSIKKLKSKNELYWDSTNSCFVVPLSQEDTFKLCNGTSEVQVRVFKDNQCKGSMTTTFDINECLSSEVLK